MPQPSAIRELDAEDIALKPELWLQADTPWVARGLNKDWPVVKAAEQGDAAFLDYLLRFCSDKKVSAFLGEPEIQGRFFYNEDLSGFNFIQLDTTLKQLADKLWGLSETENAPSLYMGSTNLDHWLPGLGEENQLEIPLPSALVSLWLGNHSIVAPHFDYPANIACCVAGVRRFTLFPPDQVANLYVGPWDLTPAGQPISLVDFRAPDYEQFPKFREAVETAQMAVLEPGDALIVPSMWWHHMEALHAFNVLVNYWWRDTPSYMGPPLSALQHAILGLRDLPEAQRRQWRELFDYYVFNPASENFEHIPEAARGVLNPIDEQTARLGATN